MPTTENRQVECSYHGELVDEDDITETGDGDLVCQNCIDLHYANCANCGGLYRCDSMYHSNRYGGDICENCHNEGEISYRDYRRQDATLIENSVPGKIIKSIRPFGVELEVTYTEDNQGDASAMTRELPRYIGIAQDGSINGLGIEIQTPPASGNKAEKLLKTVCDSLADNNASVDNSCGYHVHIDVNDIGTKNPDSQFRAIRDLWLFYLTFEDVLLSFLPSSRRQNTYCHALRTDYHFREIATAPNMDKLEQIWYRVSSIRSANDCKGEEKHGSRYRGINMHTLFSDRHLEIRFHSGTMNCRKILEWGNIHLKAVDTALNNGITASYLSSLATLSLPEKTLQFFNLLKLEKTSENYFRARQEKFTVKVNMPTMPSEAEKENMELLAQEPEN